MRSLDHPPRHALRDARLGRPGALIGPPSAPCAAGFALGAARRAHAGIVWRAAARATGAKLRRCSAQGPSARSAARCAAVTAGPLTADVVDSEDGAVGAVGVFAPQPLAHTTSSTAAAEPAAGCRVMRDRMATISVPDVRAADP